MMRAAPAILVLLALAGCGGGDPAASARAPASTLEATFVDSDGDGFLERGPGEPLVDRGGSARPGRTIATFGQLTDTHVRDEESPARAPFLDRFGAPLSSTFRPHEALSPHVLDAAVRALNRERAQAVVVTGDIVDSAQENELEQAIALLDGRTVVPDSGARGYAGVQADSNPDPFYFRPDSDAPRHPGILDAAQRPFRAAGLDAPWYPALGNHDVLVQGEVPPTPAIEEVATGGEMVTSLDPEVRVPEDDIETAIEQARLFGRTERVPADPARRHLSAEDVVERLAAAAGAGARPAGRLDYAFDIGPHVRAVVLDTVDRDGGSRGLVTASQVAWLREQLETDRWVVVFSHNRLDGAALSVLDASPHVVAAVAGNSHRNAIEPRGGYWLITTSSLADFPQQARMFRLRKAPGGVALETWMVDHDGRGLAGTARQLAFLDAHGGRPQGFAGRRGDRNARLFVRR